MASTESANPAMTQTTAVGLPPTRVTLPDAPFAQLLRRLRRNRGAMLGVIIVGLMGLVALAAPLVAVHDPVTQYSGRKLEPPSAEFLLGTDNLGRDLFSRLVHGARPSIGTAVLATFLTVTIGTAMGVLAGYSGGLLDSLIMRVVDVLLAFPGLLIALAVVGVRGPGLGNVILGVTLVSWAVYARLVRGLVLEVRERLFVQAAVATGAGRFHIMRRHILPNIISPVVVLASLEIGVLILTIAGLSFLGLGIRPPAAEWGAMLNQGRPYFQRAPQLMLYPGILISLTVLGFNLLGDGLRDVLDPRHA